jgi:hypothetical protein
MLNFYRPFFILCFGSHFENGKISAGRHFHIGRHNTAHKFNIVRFQCPELIPDIEKFLPGSIFKMATTIPQKFNIVRFQR